MDKVFTRNIVPFIIRLKNIVQVLYYLLRWKIISQDEHQTVESEPRDKQNYSLIKLLMSKDEKNLKSIFKILRVTGNGLSVHLLEYTAKQLGLIKNSSKYDSTRGRIKIRKSEYYPTENEQEGQSSTVNFSIETVSTTGGTGVQNVFNFTSQTTPKDDSKLLDEQWWPDVKEMITLLFERRIDGELIVERLHRMLQDNENKTKVTSQKVVVSGFGGIGKTTSAKSFAHHYQKEYEHIIWIECGEGSLVKSFKSLTRDLKMEDRNELELEEMARKCFKKLQQSKCLLIFDNAECYVGIEGIRNILPKHKNFHSIITSRFQEWGTKTGDGKFSMFLLDVFTKDESSQFMKKGLENCSDISDPQLDRLGVLLGHLPLALQIAMAALNNGLTTITKYIELIENSEEILHKNFDNYEKTLCITMKISLDRIETNSEGVVAMKVLNVLGYVQPDRVQFEFLQTILKINNAIITRTANLLQKYSLVTTRKEINIHRLLQQVIRHNSKATEEDTLRKILGCDGFLDYKLIPFIKHADEQLQKEFPELKAQLLDQQQLIKLLIEKRYEESVQLAHFINKELKTNTTAFNYSICLDKNEQFEEAVAVLEQLQETDMEEWVDVHMGILDLQKKVSKELVAFHLLLNHWRKGNKAKVKEILEKMKYFNLLNDSLQALLQLVCSGLITSNYSILIKNNIIGLKLGGETKKIEFNDHSVDLNIRLPIDLQELKLFQVQFKDGNKLINADLSEWFPNKLNKLSITNTACFLSLDRFPSIQHLQLDGKCSFPLDFVNANQLKYLELYRMNNCFFLSQVNAIQLTKIHFYGIKEVNVDLISPTVKQIKITNLWNTRLIGGVRNVDKLILEEFSFDSFEQVLNHFQPNQLVIYYYTSYSPNEVIKLMNEGINTTAIGRIKWSKESFDESILSKHVDRYSRCYLFEGGRGRAIEEKEFFEMFEI